MNRLRMQDIKILVASLAFFGSVDGADGRRGSRAFWEFNLIILGINIIMSVFPESDQRLYRTVFTGACRIYGDWRLYECRPDHKFSGAVFGGSYCRRVGGDGTGVIDRVADTALTWRLSGNCHPGTWRDHPDYDYEYPVCGWRRWIYGNSHKTTFTWVFFVMLFVLFFVKNLSIPRTAVPVLRSVKMRLPLRPWASIRPNTKLWRLPLVPVLPGLPEAYLPIASIL